MDETVIPEDFSYNKWRTLGIRPWDPRWKPFVELRTDLSKDAKDGCFCKLIKFYQVAIPHATGTTTMRYDGASDDTLLGEVCSSYQRRYSQELFGSACSIFEVGRQDCIPLDTRVGDIKHMLLRPLGKIEVRVVPPPQAREPCWADKKPSDGAFCGDCCNPGQGAAHSVPYSSPRREHSDRDEKPTGKSSLMAVLGCSQEEAHGCAQVLKVVKVSDEQLNCTCGRSLIISLIICQVAGILQKMKRRRAAQPTKNWVTWTVDLDLEILANENLLRSCINISDQTSIKVSDI
jgi:hypothetical protein